MLGIIVVTAATRIMLFRQTNKQLITNNIIET